MQENIFWRCRLEVSQKQNIMYATQLFHVKLLYMLQVSVKIVQLYTFCDLEYWIAINNYFSSWSQFY